MWIGEGVRGRVDLRGADRGGWGRAYPLAREGAGDDEGDVDGVAAHHHAVERVEEAHRGDGGGGGGRERERSLERGGGGSEQAEPQRNGRRGRRLTSVTRGLPRVRSRPSECGALADWASPFPPGRLLAWASLGEAFSDPSKSPKQVAMSPKIKEKR